MAVSINGTGSVTGLVITPANTQAGALPSMVRLNTANGYGSTNTVIRRFTNTVTNQGADITYTDSATLGATFTINTNGVYAISYSDIFSAQSSVGISLNSSQLAGGIGGITAADRIGIVDSGGANFIAFVSTTLYLPSGSLLRPHTSGVAIGVTPSAVQFTITRVA